MLKRQLELVEALIERNALAAADRRVVEQQRQDLQRAQKRIAQAEAGLPAAARARERIEAQIAQLRTRVADQAPGTASRGAAAETLEAAQTEHAEIVRQFDALMAGAELGQAELARVRHDTALDAFLANIAVSTAVAAQRQAVPDPVRTSMLAALADPVSVFDPRRCLCAPEDAGEAPLTFVPLASVLRLARFVATPDVEALRVDATDLRDLAPAVVTAP
ncbi:MAG: hypothetical protein U1E89_04625 [Burkholderiaceae bacterium]